MSELSLVGVSHNTATVDVRQRCAVAPTALRERLRFLRDDCGFREALILSTCNRTEVFAVADDVVGSAERLRRAFFDEQIPASAFYRHQGLEAAFHLFRVAAGLDSQVLGEGQILAQLKDAAQAAREENALSATLTSLVEGALAAGKRVRTETRIGEGTLSVAKAAVELAQKVFGSFHDVHALIVGAGETGLLVARHLKDAGCRELNFTNRSFERALTAASEYGGKAHPFEKLSAEVARADLTIVSVDGASPLIRAEMLDLGSLRKHDRPPMLIDISVPRAIDADLKAVEDLLVHDIDDLDSIVSRHRVEREAEIQAASSILVSEVQKWLGLRAYSALKPLITELVMSFEKIRLEVLEADLAAGWSRETFSEKLSRRLLDDALSRLKRGTRQWMSEEQIERRYKNHLERS